MQGKREKDGLESEDGTKFARGEADLVWYRRPKVQLATYDHDHWFYAGHHE